MSGDRSERWLTCRTGIRHARRRGGCAFCAVAGSATGVGPVRSVRIGVGDPTSPVKGWFQFRAVLSVGRARCCS